MSRDRYRAAATVLAILVIIAPASKVSAEKRPRIPSLPELATVWVGGSAGALEYYRLSLGSDGTGILTVQFMAGQEAVLYRVTRTELLGARIRFDVQPVDAAAEAIDVQGRALPTLLALTVRGRARKWERSVTFERYDDLLARIKAVTERASS